MYLEENDDPTKQYRICKCGTRFEVTFPTRLWCTENCRKRHGAALKRRRDKRLELGYSIARRSRRSDEIPEIDISSIDVMNLVIDNNVEDSPKAELPKATPQPTTDPATQQHDDHFNWGFDKLKEP